MPRALTSDARVGAGHPARRRATRIASPNTGTEAALERTYAAAHRVARADRPAAPRVREQQHRRRDEHARQGGARREVHAEPSTYPTSGLGQTLKTVAGAMAKGVGTKVFWVQLGGFDTHASQVGTERRVPAADDRAERRGDGLLHRPAGTRACSSQALLVTFSEFGRRVYENGSVGCDHGAAGLMFALGGARPRRALRHGRVAQPRSREPHAREQRRRRALRDRLPVGLRARHRQLARRRLGRPARRRLPETGPRVRLGIPRRFRSRRALECAAPGLAERRHPGGRQTPAADTRVCCQLMRNTGQNREREPGASRGAELAHRSDSCEPGDHCAAEEQRHETASRSGYCDGNGAESGRVGRRRSHHRRFGRRGADRCR